ncbi:MAG: hypothetical protein ACE5IQ_10940 [Candidatus Methylomirabilales bacterium]
MVKRLAFFLIVIVLVSSAATAQTRPPLARLKISLWPEYDRPAVLVMLHGWLAVDAALPAIVPLPMPAQAGKPHAVAKGAPDGELLMAQHMVDVQGDWAKINVMTDMREVRVEYYVDFPTTDPLRRYVFEWPGGLDVKKVTYEVMQPSGAKDLSVRPPPSTQTVGNDGLTYHLGNLGPKTRKDTFSIEISYTKTTPTLTAAALRPSASAVGQTPPAGGAPGETPATPSGSGGANIWLLALMIVLGAALGGAWVFMAKKKPRGKR